MAGPRRVSKRGHTHDTRALVVAAHAQGVSTPTARTGMPPTALVVQVGEHPALRSDSSRHPTGAPLSAWLDQREAGLDQPLARIRCAREHRSRRGIEAEAVSLPGA